MPKNWWEDDTPEVKKTPVKAEKKVEASPNWWEDDVTDQNPGTNVGGSLQDSEAETAMRDSESPVDIVSGLWNESVRRMGGRLGLSDENYKAIGGDNEAVPELLRPFTNVLPDAVNLGTKALFGGQAALETVAGLVDKAADVSGAADALSIGGQRFQPGRTALDVGSAFPGLGAELGHLPGGRFMSPKRDILPPEVRQVLNEQVNAMWEAGASAQEINRFNVKNKLRPYTKEEMAELEKLAAERDAARTEAEATVVAPTVKPFEPNTTAEGTPAGANDNANFNPHSVDTVGVTAPDVPPYTPVINEFSLVDGQPTDPENFLKRSFGVNDNEKSKLFIAANDTNKPGVNLIGDRTGEIPESVKPSKRSREDELSDLIDANDVEYEANRTRIRELEDIEAETGALTPAQHREWQRLQQDRARIDEEAEALSEAEIAYWNRGERKPVNDNAPDTPLSRLDAAEKDYWDPKYREDERAFAHRNSKAYKAYRAEGKAREETLIKSYEDYAKSLSDKELDNSIEFTKNGNGGGTFYSNAIAKEKARRENSEVNQSPVSDVATGIPAPEGVTSVSRATPEAPPTASQKLFRLLGGVKEKLTQQAADRSTELSKRVKAAAAEGADKSGREGFEAEKQHLKGALPTETGKNIRDKFTEEDIAALYDEIKSYPGFRYFDTVNARTGLTRFLDGDIPRPSELQLMEKVFGPEVVKKMMRNRKEIVDGIRGKGRGEQGELFGGSEATSTGPLTPPLKPEPKPVDPNKFIDDPKQGDLFRDKPKSRAPTPPDKEGQLEMFSGAETTSSGPIRTLADEPKKTDPDKFIDDPYQGDFFKDKPKFQKLFEDAKKIQKERPDPGLLAKLLGTVRQMKATIDLSMPGNQGWGFLAHPEFYRALKPMVVEAYYGLSKNPAHYLIREKQMRADPMFQKLEDMGVTFTDASGQRTLGEESFSTGYAQNIPAFGNLVEASNFGASTFLNELRFNVGKKFYNDAKKAGVDVEDKLFQKSLADIVNALSGRGSLGKFEPAAGAAATALFSPRFLASRIQMMNPWFYRKLHPAMRKEMIKSMAGAAAISSGVLAAMVAMGIPVVTDPKSTDFAKVKIGNTRYDVFGGLTSYVTMASRIISNKTTNSEGKTTELGKRFGSRTGKDVALDFLTNKTAPVPNYALRALDGKNIDGTEFEPLKEAGKLLVPMYVEANYDAMVEYGVPEGFLRALPGFFGINTNTYPDKKEVKPVGKTPEGPVPDWAK